MSKNSMTISMEIEGLDEAIKKLKLYDNKSSLAIARSIRKGGVNIQNNAKSKARVKTGTLRDNIKAKMSTTKLQSAVRVDYRKAPHAHLIEYGVAESYVKPSRKKALKINGRFAKGAVKIPKRRARPFLRPAFDIEKPRVETEIKKVLRVMP